MAAHYKKYKDVSIDDVRFSYDLLKPLLDNNGTPLYVKKTPQNINFEFIIPKRNIPHQHYYQADEDDTPVLEDIEYDV